MLGEDLRGRGAESSQVVSYGDARLVTARIRQRVDEGFDPRREPIAGG